MYVCMYVGMYVCGYVYMYVCGYVCMWVCMYVCGYVCMYVGMYVCVDVCVRGCALCTSGHSGQDAERSPVHIVTFNHSLYASRQAGHRAPRQSYERQDGRRRKGGREERKRGEAGGRSTHISYNSPCLELALLGHMITCVRRNNLKKYEL